MKNKHLSYLYAILAVASLLFGCESQEDTYKDYAEGSKIRYVGRSTNGSIQAGWKRFLLKWTNSSDATIKNIRIIWSAENQTDSVTLPSDMTSYETEPIFEDLSYTFTIYALDGQGNKSLPEMVYARPFSLNHDLVKSYTTMVRKYFYVENNLFVLLDVYNPNMVSIKISFYRDGSPVTNDITKEMFDKGYMVLEGIDLDHAVTIERVAFIEGCLDQVTFNPHELEKRFNAFNYDFKKQLQERYNLTDLTPEFINNTKEVHLNYSLKSLEDVLYFPLLEKLVLGGERYMIPGKNTPASRLDETNLSLRALEFMREHRGIEVEIYNNHYNLLSDLDFATGKGNPDLPTLSYLDTEGWTVKHIPEDAVDLDNSAEAILDGDPLTLWAAMKQSTNIRTHELTIDMKEVKTIHGFRVTQTQKGDFEKYLSDFIHVQISTDNLIWKEALNQAQTNLGAAIGESTVLRMPEETTARYIKIIIPDKINPPYRNTCLGDFMVF